ncbi:hypothetical protein [Catenovulum sediminis]|uniref:hypothetical protein n=1 Tax=Catenovulum sediminis TaxID=1740262 RepID=UPI00117E0C58|nr:hypothetical protein [Catenovulum sediminis]
MTLLEQATALFDVDITVDTARKLLELEEQANGNEAKKISELFEAFAAAASEEVYKEAFRKGYI